MGALCDHTERAIVTCGGCGRQWCESCDPAPSALCHYCHGRGFSLAPRGVPIRFREWINGGHVFMTLAPGQTRYHTSGGQTEEGYSYSAMAWSYDGAVLSCECTTDARDCDGRLTAYNDYQATELDENRQPVWERVDSSQRDYTAEAMGY